MDATLILHLILWPPLIGFLINGLFGNSIPKWAVSIIACLGPLTSFTGTVLAYKFLSGLAHDIPLYTWFIVEGSAKINFGFYIDHLAIIMLFVV